MNRDFTRHQNLPSFALQSALLIAPETVKPVMPACVDTKGDFVLKPILNQKAAADKKPQSKPSARSFSV